MLMKEVASAEEQIALFKLVIDSVWAALAVQQEQQAKALSAKQAKAKPKTKTKSAYSFQPLPKPPSPQPTQPIATHKKAFVAPVLPKNNTQIVPNRTEKDAVTSAIKGNGKQQ